MNIKSQTTETTAVITETTNGKFYISINGEGNGYDAYADTMEQAIETAHNLIADWDGFETESTDPAEDEYNRFMDAINAADVETLDEIADNAWEYTETKSQKYQIISDFVGGENATMKEIEELVAEIQIHGWDLSANNDHESVCVYAERNADYDYDEDGITPTRYDNWVQITRDEYYLVVATK